MKKDTVTVMKAMRLYGKNDMRFEDLPIPACGPGQVLVKTLFCGVCGSDPPRVLDGAIRISPAALGHEFSAIVVETGEDVGDAGGANDINNTAGTGSVNGDGNTNNAGGGKDACNVGGADGVIGVSSTNNTDGAGGVDNAGGLKPGDLVCCVPLIVCNACPNCMDGNYGQCVKSRFIGASFHDIGGFHEYNALPAQNVFKLPEGMDPLAAAFMEPASVALHSLNLIGYQPHEDLAIVGVGGIGQLVLQCARAMGGGRIFAFDKNERRLETAVKMGAAACFNTREDGFKERFLEYTAGLGSPQVIEAVGLEETIILAATLAKVNGRIGIIGTMHEPVTLAPDIFYQVISRRQLWLRGVWMSYSKGFPGAAWRLAARYLADRRINIQPLLFEVATIEDAFLAISQYNEPDNVTGKIVIKM